MSWIWVTVLVGWQFAVILFIMISGILLFTNLWLFLLIWSLRYILNYRLLRVSLRYKQTHLVVWQMKEFGVEDSWIQLFNISYHNLQIYDHFNDLNFRVLPLCLSEKSDTLLLTNSLESQAILYNWRYNIVERIYKPRFNGMNYVESLVSCWWK